MDNSIFLLEEQDNVGDVLGKINYNFLKHNNDLYDLERINKNNSLFLNKIDRLMDRLDYLIVKTDFDKLQDFYTTINYLSSYWNNYEFSVQYPFNTSNGFTSSLVSLGKAGDLLGSTALSEHQSILIKAILMQDLPYIETEQDAGDNLYNNGIIMVNRSDAGNFVSWDFLNASNILNVLTDSTGNLYYNGRLVDIYNIPYKSAIVGSNVDLTRQSLIPNYDTKTASVNGNTVLEPDKTSISGSSLIEYETFVYDEYNLGDGTVAPISQFVPTVYKLSAIIPYNNTTFAAKIQGMNADLNDAYTDNSKINNLAIDFLNENYPAAFYPSSTVVNVVFFLYNSLVANGEAVVETLFWDNETKSISQKKIEVITNSNITKIAPSSNTTYKINYTKQNIYIEKIVSLRYEKHIEQKEISTLIGGVNKVTTLDAVSWKYKGINIGRNYTPNLFLNTNNKKAEISGEPSLIYNG